MARKRLRHVDVLLDDGTSVTVGPDDDLPEGVRDSDLNPKAFEPWTGDADSDEDLSYDDMTQKELLAEVKRRGLEPDSTKKADLQAALEEDDGVNG